MLQQNTVFILGAGSSYPYGFPTGPGMLETVLTLGKKISSPRPDQPTMYDMVIAAGFTPDDVTRFTNALAHSVRMSVDAFLEGRPQYLGIGKVAMAAALLPLQRHAPLFDRNADQVEQRWYGYLFNKLATRLDDWDQVRTAFLTFNYDMSLEYYLAVAFQNAYDLPLADALGRVKKLRFIHLYGDLGEVTEETAGRWENVTPPSTEEIHAAANRIHIVHTDERSKEFAVARYFIDEADVIFFLGFGFHPTNVERLLDSQPTKDRKVVRGTAFRMGAAESASATGMVQRVYPDVSFGQPNETVLGYLRDHFVWW